MDERDHSAARDQAIELGDRADVGTREAVDRLRRVADHREIRRGTEPCPEQQHLQRGRVLELVDEQMTEPPALPIGELGIACDEVGAAAQDVVEVEQPLLSLGGLVACVHLGHAVGGPRHPAGRQHRRLRVLGGRDQPRLGPLDLARDLGHRLRGGGPTTPDYRTEKPRFAVEHLRLVPAPFRRVPAELRQCDRVERAAREATVDTQRVEPVEQLPGRLPRERERQHVARNCGAFADAVRDAPRQHTRLARPRGSDDREGDVRRGDGSALL